MREVCYITDLEKIKENFKKEIQEFCKALGWEEDEIFKGDGRILVNEDMTEFRIEDSFIGVPYQYVYQMIFNKNSVIIRKYEKKSDYAFGTYYYTDYSFEWHEKFNYKYPSCPRQDILCEGMEKAIKEIQESVKVY